MYLYLQSASQSGGHLLDQMVKPFASSFRHNNRPTRMDLVVGSRILLKKSL